MSHKSSLINAINKNNSHTLNGGVTNNSSDNYNLDLFFQISSMRNMDAEDIIKAFLPAFSECPLTALKTLFWCRDIRSGQGERSTFRIILRHMAVHSPKIMIKNVHNIPKFGRWDDLFCLFDTPVESEALNLISCVLSNPYAQATQGQQHLPFPKGRMVLDASLCAKWMPREKSSKRSVAKKIMKHMGLSPKSYRKMLSSLTSVVENNMCSKDWDAIEHSRVPSVAMLRYRSAFERNSPEKWGEFIASIEAGEVVANSATLHPHQIAHQTLRSGYDAVLESQWDNLPNYLMNNPKRILPVVDVSGSMACSISAKSDITCMDVSVSLGLYIAERNNGPFKDFFVTFSETPSLVRATGSTLYDRLSLIRGSDWGYSTDLHSVFQLLLKNAVENDIAEEDMPNTILVLSDMEFDPAHHLNEYSSIDAIRAEYSTRGYDLPEIVFWNLNARLGNVPVKYDDNGTALVSGFSPSIMREIISTSKVCPMAIMKKVIDSPRYNCVML